jgi:hypothetical protein
VKNVSAEANLPLVDGDQLDFSMKLFDLNQVGAMKFTVLKGQNFTVNSQQGSVL